MRDFGILGLSLNAPTERFFYDFLKSWSSSFNPSFASSLTLFRENANYPAALLPAPIAGRVGFDRFDIDLFLLSPIKII